MALRLSRQPCTCAAGRPKCPACRAWEAGQRHERNDEVARVYELRTPHWVCLVHVDGEGAVTERGDGLPWAYRHIARWMALRQLLRLHEAKLTIRRTTVEDLSA